MNFLLTFQAAPNLRARNERNGFVIAPPCGYKHVVYTQTFDEPAPRASRVLN